MKKLMTASLMMALGVAGAQAGGGYADNTQYVTPATTQTVAAPAATMTPGVITDVPAGHWAREAVAHVVEAGLIEGFPDGTFRGNEYLTRYQAAMIFHRLLQSGALSNMEGADLTVITRGMQEVSEELAAISSRLTDVERLTVEQEARIDALESAIADLDTGDNSMLVARIDALEARIAELENMDYTPAPAPAPVTPAPVTPVAPAPAPVEEVKIEPGDITLGEVEVDMPTVTTGMGNTYFGIGGGYYPTDGDYNKAGTGIAGAGTQLGADVDCINAIDGIANAFKDDKDKKDGEPVDYCGSVFATFGASDLMEIGGLGLGARGNIEYMPGANNAVGGDINAMTNFDLGLIQPYLGAGVGVVYGPESFATDAKSETDFYGNLLAGADFQLAQNIGLFAEANGKYFFSNKTEAVQRQVVNDTTDEESDFGYGFRGGLKFFF